MRTSRLSRAVAVALLASAFASPVFATEYYTVTSDTSSWWTKAVRSTKKAVTNTVKTVTGTNKGNGQWTATTRYSDGSTQTQAGGN